MTKRTRVFFFVGLLVSFFCLFLSNSWASPFEILPNPNSIINLGIYSEIEGTSERFNGDNPNWGDFNIYDLRTVYVQVLDDNDLTAWRGTTESWNFGYLPTDAGFTIYSNMTVTTSYIYEPGYEPITNPGYAYAFSGVDGGVFQGYAKLNATDQMPLGTVVPFAIQIETSDTPWAVCEWEFTMDGVTVSQDNYDQVVFNLMVGEAYTVNFVSPYLGMQTQSIVDGSLESGFNFHFTQVPVPIPGALWLLGSGLFGLAGLRRKFLN